MVPEKTAEDFKKQMAKPDLVFITKENEEQLKAEAEQMATQALPEMGCAHGRAVGVPCPHCVGINGIH